MRLARIFSPAKTAMQSGKGRTGRWILEYDPDGGRSPEPLMGYSSVSDTANQVRLTFSSKGEAIAYAEKHSLAYQMSEPSTPKRRKMAYSDNFAFSRKGSWTH